METGLRATFWWLGYAGIKKAKALKQTQRYAVRTHCAHFYTYGELYIQHRSWLDLMSDEILFDLDGLTGIELQKQICLRLDRQFPSGLSDHLAGEATALAEKMVADSAVKLREAGFGELADQLLGLI